jgi:hypothetical protein
MILVDTNIIINFWKNPSEKIADIFASEEIVICGIVKAELLHGARNEKDFKTIIEALSEFPFLEIGNDLWDFLGNVLFQLRRNGLTIPFQDAVLTALALMNNARIWTDDKHFQLVAPVFPDLLFYTTDQ